MNALTRNHAAERDAKLLSLLTDSERTKLDWPMAPELMMETAMTLWEVVLEGEIGSSQAASLRAYRDRVGTVQLRHDIMAIVPMLHIGWHVHWIAAEGDLCVFDWEFVPWFWNACVDIDLTSGLTVKPDWLAKCRALRG